MRRLAALTALLALLAACGGGDDDEAATTTTTKRPTTTTEATMIAGGAFPLTGLPANGSPNLGRPALAVKFDNAPKARMQAGLNRADIVYEEKVEDGVTRFLAMYHSDGADPIGPIRSARTTDIALAGSYNRPLFAYSGTNATFQRAIDSAPLVDLSPDKANVYFRQKGRRAPYNLFSRTSAFYERAPEGMQPPPPQFAYRAPGDPFTASGARPSPGVDLSFRGRNITTNVEWRWDAAAGVYRRSTDGQLHVDALDNQPVGAKNVIVQVAEYVDTGERDQSGEPVPEAKLIGEGEAWVFSDGKVAKARWSKPSLEVPTRFVDGEGRVIRLAPGQTWVEIPPPGMSTVR